MKLGMEVGSALATLSDRGPGFPCPKGAQPPIFGQCLLWANGWIKMPLGKEVGLGPSDIVLDGDPAPLPQKGHSSPQLFGP